MVSAATAVQVHPCKRRAHESRSCKNKHRMLVISTPRGTHIRPTRTSPLSGLPCGGFNRICQTVNISSGSERRRIGNKQKPRSFFRNVKEPGVRLGSAIAHPVFPEDLPDDVRIHSSQLP